MEGREVEREGEGGKGRRKGGGREKDCMLSLDNNLDYANPVWS